MPLVISATVKVTVFLSAELAVLFELKISIFPPASAAPVTVFSVNSSVNELLEVVLSVFEEPVSLVVFETIDKFLMTATSPAPVTIKPLLALAALTLPARSTICAVTT